MQTHTRNRHTIVRPLRLRLLRQPLTRSIQTPHHLQRACSTFLAPMWEDTIPVMAFTHKLSDMLRALRTCTRILTPGVSLRILQVHIRKAYPSRDPRPKSTDPNISHSQAWTMRTPFRTSATRICHYPHLHHLHPWTRVHRTRSHLWHRLRRPT